MSIIVTILVAAGAIMLMSLVGVLFVGKFAASFLNQRLSYLVAFSAGVFLITSGALLLEVFHIYEGMIGYGIAFVLAGYALAWGIEAILPESHHHHDPADPHDHHHGKGSARKLLIGDSIHNIGDGIILVPAFMVSPALGLAVTVSIMIHEALQEISEFFVLKQAGYSTGRALLLNFVTASTILVGVAISYFALATPQLEGVLLAVSAGFFLHVVMHDLLPRRHEHESAKLFLAHVAVLALGLAAMASIAVALGETHTHGEADAHADEEHDVHSEDHAHDEHEAEVHADADQHHELTEHHTESVGTTTEIHHAHE
jgi:zinc and cadmium transporter